MEHHRKQAKTLVRAHRAGEPEAIARAEAVLGTRARQRFLLSDAQHVVAHEQGFRTWRDLTHARESPDAWTDGTDVVMPTRAIYGPGRSVEVVVRKRGWRYDISDGGRAVELAGRPPGWRDVADRVAEEQALNVNRSGVVFVQANEARLEHLVARVAECSRELYEELLELSG